MPFEYDPRKSASNHAKHGIDFEQAQQLWDDEAYLEILARNLDEPRSLVIGKIAEKHWSAVITYRDENITGTFWENASHRLDSKLAEREGVNQLRKIIGLIWLTQGFDHTVN